MRNIPIATFAVFLFISLASLTDAQTLTSDTVDFDSLYIDPNLSVPAHDILSVTLPTTKAPTKWVIIYASNDTTTTLVTTAPVVLRYRPKVNAGSKQ